MKTIKIPEVTIMRLAMYSRYLLGLKNSGEKITSSRKIADTTGVTSAQVRKDLAYFGEFGVRGVGYDVDDLCNRISQIIGVNREWKIVIIGAGNLGGALVSYSGFQQRGFHIKAIFDEAPDRVGQEVGGLVVKDMKGFETYVERNEVDIAVIVVPYDKAQSVADVVVENGINAILNFAPVVLNVPSTVDVRNVDFSIYLETLSYHMVSKGKVKKRK